jgi:hypothetical protein
MPARDHDAASTPPTSRTATFEVDPLADEPVLTQAPKKLGRFLHEAVRSTRTQAWCT